MSQRTMRAERKLRAKQQTLMQAETVLRKELEAQQRQAATEGPVVYNNKYGVIHESAFKDATSDEETKFKKALNNGPVGGQGAVGIKKLGANQFELKILGAGGSARIYGDKREDGLIHFIHYESTH